MHEIETTPAPSIVDCAIATEAQDTHCEFYSDAFDLQGTIYCNLDGDYVLSSRDVPWLSDLARALNRSNREEYITKRDFIRTWL